MKYLIAILSVLLLLAACNDQPRRTLVVSELPPRVHWQQAGEEDLAGLDPAKRNLFALRSVEHEVWAWGERKPVDPANLKKSGWPKAFVESVVQGAQKSGANLGGQIVEEAEGRYLAKCLFQPTNGSEPFIGIFAVTEVGFTAITVKGDTVFELDSEELGELMPMIDVEL